MASIHFFPILLIISLAPSSFSPAIAGDEDLAYLPCVKELLPCHPYVHELEPPPSHCCLPLLSAIQKEAACLCAVFYSEPILMALNLTRDEALMIPRSCGGYVPDFDSCNGGGGSGDVPAPWRATPPNSSPTSQDGPESSAATPAKPSPPSNSSSPSSSSNENSAVRVGLPILAGGLVSVAILALM
ncbi:lipid transfer-like protein VAS [Phalaenopsis equestris]|uniref:lipid transfer-like protein VAS n=1 Tax=Phalaenopsis equestris TaxID=78828 RepID=UPI0009E357AB|nr:lipid transfer-like protein VAS [Phalaenopsis equestris]